LKRRGPAEGVVTVFVSDEQAALPIVVEKWQQLPVVGPTLVGRDLIASRTILKIFRFCSATL
jgi:hypothetical protein